MIVAIIAGGKGKRLGIDGIPKPMIKIAGKPLLEHQINLAKKYGFTNIYILSGFLSEKITDYFGDGKRFGVNIHHIVEREPLGTAGALKQLEHKINNTFMVFYGDTVMDIHLSDMVLFHKKCPSIATLLVHPNDHPYDSDLLDMDDDNYITAFHPKPHHEGLYCRNLVNAALYILEPEIFQYIPKDKASDFGKSIFPFLLQSGKKIKGYYTAEYIKDIGTPQRLEKVTADFANGKVSKLNKSNKREAIFIDRDGVINKETDNLCNVNDFELLDAASNAIKNLNSSKYLSIIVTNQPVVAKGFCTENDVKRIHDKMESLLGNSGAYIDYIYYCPHHPDKGFNGERKEYKIECSCRKPKTGLIEEAVNKFNIDIEKSFIIGDSSVDIMTGINAGLATILVRTGYAGSDGKFQVEPDFIFNDLNESIDFIINNYRTLTEDANFILSQSIKELSGNKIILIGGLSRSGKSTLASILVLVLKRIGIITKVLKLDNWLLDVEERKECMAIMDRYDYPQIVQDIRDLLQNKVIHTRRYNPIKRSKDKNSCTFTLKDNEFLIIEGAASLDIEYLRNIANIKLYLQIPEDLRKIRFFDFYKFKGLSHKEIDRLYFQRQLDESPIILKTKEYADYVLDTRGIK